MLTALKSFLSKIRWWGRLKDFDPKFEHRFDRQDTRR
jgi:hypothetical protein